MERLALLLMLMRMLVMLLYKLQVRTMQLASYILLPGNWMSQSPSGPAIRDVRQCVLHPSAWTAVFSLASGGDIDAEDGLGWSSEAELALGVRGRARMELDCCCSLASSFISRPGRGVLPVSASNLTVF
jgi:hypothetical protein